MPTTRCRCSCCHLLTMLIAALIPHGWHAWPGASMAPPAPWQALRHVKLVRPCRVPEQRRCRTSGSGDAATGQNDIDGQQQLSRRRKSEPTHSAVDSAAAPPHGLRQLLPARPLTFSKYGAGCLRVHVLQWPGTPKPNQPQLKGNPAQGSGERCVGRHLAPQPMRAVSIPKRVFILAASCAKTRKSAAIRKLSGSGHILAWTAPPKASHLVFFMNPVK